MEKILITNDDGPDTPLLKPFLEQLEKETNWEIYTIIPDKQQSWTSKAITRYQIVEIKKTSEKQWQVSGTPATCVNIALYNILKEQQISLVISGPNFGHNVGRSSILSSGTVGGAVEAAIAGKKAIALSFPYFGKTDEKQINNAIKNAVNIVKILHNDWEPNTHIYNVNIPLNIEKKPEVIFTKIWRDNYKQLFTEIETNKYKQTGGVSPSKVEKPTLGTDMWAIKNKKISISRINIDL